jgi:hypothetical protein
MVGRGIFLDGFDGTVSVAPSPDLTLADWRGVTVETWIRPDDPTYQQAIIEGNDGSGTIGLQFWICITGLGGPRSIFASLPDTSGISHYVASAANVLTTNYQHVAMTYDKNSGVAKIYLNGTVVASQNVGSFTPRTVFPLWIGSRPSGPGQGSFFKGIIDELSVYKRALTDSEIAAIVNAAGVGKCAGPSAPFIVTQPSSSTVFLGRTVTLKVDAGGTPPLWYQWLHEGNPIKEATNGSYTLNNVQVTNAGLYAVLVTNLYGSILSSNAIITLDLQLGCTNLPPDIVSWWKGDGNADDIIDGNAGVFLNGGYFTNGMSGQAFWFDGINDHVRIPDNPNQRFTNSLSIEAWVDPDHIGVYHELISKWDPSGQCSYTTGIHPDGRVYFTVSPTPTSAGAASVFSTNVLAPGKWTHFAGTYDGNSMRIYLNGVQENQTAYTAGIYRGTSDLGIGGYVGGMPIGQVGSPFAGGIDEPAIYGRGLSAEEIRTIFNVGPAGKCLKEVVPYIFQQPNDQTITEGEDVTFNVVALGTPPLCYQWAREGLPLDRATNASFSILGAQVGQSGKYSVSVTNLFGASVSSNALLTVKARPPCAPVQGFQVSWWPGEGNCLDVAGQNGGTLYGNAGFTQGVVTQAFSFDGVNGHVRIPDSTSLHVANEATIEVWVNPSRSSSYQHLVSKWNAIIGPNQRSYILQLIPGNQAMFTVSRDGTDATAKSVPSKTTVPVNQWTHLAGTYDGLTVRIYVNGQLDGSNAYTSSQGIFRGTGDLGLGASVGGAPHGNVSNPLAGQLDEPSIYARVLSETEINSIYQAGAGGKCFAPSSPFIIAQPANLTNLLGETASFEVAAGGTPPLYYQWMSNAVPILLATNATLTLTNLALDQSGVYAAIVYNDFGSVTSSNAILHVLAAPLCTPIPTNLVSWWTGEGNCLDQAGGNTGTLVGNASYATGYVGQAFAFDGENDLVTFRNPTNLQLQTLTIELWMKRGSSQFVSPGSSGPALLAGWGAGGYGLFLDAAGRPAFGRVGGTTVTVFTSPYITDTNWHHLAVTKSSTTVYFYVDGVQRGVQYLSGSFVFTNSVGLGARPDTLTSDFFGLLDEVSIYRRALTASEVAGVYAAKVTGKCAANFPPVITAQPASQDVFAGADVAFTVILAGTPPFRYQWNYKGNPIDGATGSMLTLTNVSLEKSGMYGVTVSNLFGAQISSNAVLTVTLPPSVLHVADSDAKAGGTVIVPILLVANGVENAFSFSLNFDPAILSYMTATVGDGAAGAILLPNTTLANGGKVGISVALSSGSFAKGTQEVARINFAVAALGGSTTTPLVFGDQPTARAVSDDQLNSLPAAYSNGLIRITAVSAFEADVFPRPGGDRRLSINDWLLMGRYAARLDTPVEGLEFQIGDCAPRASSGDGVLRVSDWVQAGRYYQGLDSLTAAGGPSNAVPAVAPAPSVTRFLSVSGATLPPGQSGEVTVSLSTQGDENALGFSLVFDPGVVSWGAARLGADAAGGSLLVNTNQAAQGRVGLVLALGIGTVLAPGNREALKVELKARVGGSGQSVLTFGDEPVVREVCGVVAEGLPVSFGSSGVVVQSTPALRVERVEQGLALYWPPWASNYVLQEAQGDLLVPANWKDSSLSTRITNNENMVIAPISAEPGFFRLRVKP